MIKVENINVMNFKNAIRGIRNAMASWDKSDSDWCWSTGYICDNCPWGYACAYNYSEHDGGYILGPNDLDLAQRLVKAGSDERKFLRQIFVSMDITAPILWWKEMSTYKVATVANSTSTMHSLTSKPITKDMFSFDETYDDMAERIVTDCEYIRLKYLETKDKRYWRTLIEILPQSYNQMRTWTANYEVLRNIYHARKNHPLDEWRSFCEIIETLPYAKELICS